MNLLKKYLPSGSFTIMILCFLLPFFIVKCNWQEFMNIKWYNYLWIWSPSFNKPDNSFFWIKTPEEKKSKNENSEINEKTNVKFNIFAFILFLILFSWAVFWVSKTLQKNIFNWKIDEKSFNKIFFWLSIASLIFIVIFILDLKFDSSNQISKEMEKYISINLWSGLNFLILISILNIIFYWYELKIIENFRNKWNQNNENIEEKN